MIAKVKDSPPPALTRKPGSHESLHGRKAPGGKAQSSPTAAAVTPTQFIKLTYDPTAAPSSQFSFNPPYLTVSDPDGTPINVSLDPSGAGELTPTPIQWINYPSSISNPSDPAFTVSPPLNYSAPWAFVVNVNYGNVKNITSPSYYLVKPAPLPPDRLEFTLTYDYTTGQFQFGDNEDGLVTVAHQQILINVLPINYRVTLKGGPTFNQNPIVWSPGTTLGANGWPNWVTPLPSAPGLDETKKILTFSIPGPISGQSAGIQFAVDVPDGNGGSITVLSPDPILINATIGDG